MGRLCNCQGATELRAMVQIDETGRAWNACDLICTNCGGYAEKPEQEAAISGYSRNASAANRCAW